MKRYFCLFCALLLTIACLGGCTKTPTQTEAPAATTADPYETLVGRFLETDAAYFFVSDADGRLLQKDEFVVLSVTSTGVDLSSYVTGDRVEIKLLTVMESYPPRAKLYGITLLSNGSPDSIPQEVIDELAQLGYHMVSP